MGNPAHLPVWGGREKEFGEKRKRFIFITNKGGSLLKKEVSRCFRERVYTVTLRERKREKLKSHGGKEVSHLHKRTPRHEEKSVCY